MFLGVAETIVGQLLHSGVAVFFSVFSVLCIMSLLIAPVYTPRNYYQCAKTVVSDSPELVDFVIRLVNSVINLPDGQVMFF